MPKDDINSDLTEFGEGMLRNFTLLALPWLSFQREVLKIMKSGMEDASSLKPTEKFTLSELQALMMIFDRSRTFRDLIDEDFEKKVEDAFKEIFPKLASASIQVVEAQDKILAGLFEALKKVKTAGEAEKSSGGKAGDRSD